MDNPFFNFFKPVFDYIDSGALFRNPFKWFYGILAVINLLFPFLVLYGFIDQNLFSYGAKVVFLLIIVLIILFAAAIFSFQLWVNRMNKVGNLTTATDNFVITPVFTHFIQTFGEWLGCYIAIVGTLVAIFSTLFLGASDGSMFLSGTALGFMDFSVAGIVLMPIYGFITLCVFRFISEQARALVTIANNTKK